MLSVEQALERLLSAAQPVTDVEPVDTMLANGRVLATAVVSAIDVPPLDNSQMDGYAVRTVGCTGHSDYAARQSAHRRRSSRCCARAWNRSSYFYRCSDSRGSRCGDHAGKV